MADVMFPADCRLSPAERQALRGILGKNDAPCDGCAWASECPGPVAAREKLIKTVANVDRVCQVCGADLLGSFQSKVLPGVFHRCSRDESEYTFIPNADVHEDEDPNDIAF